MKSRYTTRGKVWDSEGDLIVPDEYPAHETGLVDHRGLDLVRLPDRVGFINLHINHNMVRVSHPKHNMDGQDD